MISGSQIVNVLSIYDIFRNILSLQQSASPLLTYQNEKYVYIKT